MASQSILCVLVVFSYAGSIACPTFTCESLDANVCATKNLGIFQVNANGCEAGSYCFGGAVIFWSGWTYKETNTTLLCFPGSPLDSFNPSHQVVLHCPPPDPSKKFKSGNMVISCSSSDDCELVDGSHTTCRCWLNSYDTGICSPSDQNEDWLGANYWRDCGADYFIEDRNTAIYWQVYGMAWITSHSSINCLDVFAEINSLQEFQDQIDTGASYDSFKLNDESTAMVLASGSLGLLALH